MAAYLLTWNPRVWPWDHFQETINLVNRLGSAPFRWSCGNTKRILKGDRVFLLRQTVEPRGLIGSGWVTDGSHRDCSNDDDGESSTRKNLYVEFDFDVLMPSPVIGRGELHRSIFGGVNWNAQASGISINPKVARALEMEWGRRIGSHFEPSPDEIDATEYDEGAATRVTVNAYERDAQARQACIAHYGCKCFICGFDFFVEYGEVAEGLIHVHHRIELAQRGGRYRVNPLQDLVPVCPNCHAVIHRRNPCYEVEEVIAIRREALKVQKVAT